MNRSTHFRLIVRVLLLLVGATALDGLVVSHLPGISAEQGQVVLVLLMAILAWVYVRPVLGELMRPPKEVGRDLSQDQSAPAAGVSATKEGLTSSTKAIAVVGLLTLVLWIAVASLVGVTLRHDGNVTSLLRAGVMITGVISALLATLVLGAISMAAAALLPISVLSDLVSLGRARHP